MFVVDILVSFAQTLRGVCFEAISDCTILVLSMQVEQNAVKSMFKKNTEISSIICVIEKCGCSQESIFLASFKTTSEVHTFITLTVAKLKKKKILIEYSTNEIKTGFL